MRERPARVAIDAVLLEFDGVLADTRLVRREAMAGVLESEGIPLSDAAYREHCAGHSTADAVRALIAHHDLDMDETGLDLLTLRIDRAFSQHIAKGVMLVDGARETVERLASRVRLGVVSRLKREDVEFVLSLAGLEDAFRCVIGADDAYPRKPDPAPYFAALRRLDGRRPIPARGLVVTLEDSSDGIRAARAAHLRCIAVGDVPAHLAMEADAIIPSIAGVDVSSLEHLVAHAGENFA
ncbi:MAG: HAD family phosphatase [Gemmatimonadaceae bacterium]